jgi:hypothetical protein
VRGARAREREREKREGEGERGRGRERERERESERERERDDLTIKCGQRDERFPDLLVWSLSFLLRDPYAHSGTGGYRSAAKAA